MKDLDLKQLDNKQKYKLNISFDALPLISDNMSGIGYCEAGLAGEMIRKHSEDTFIPIRADFSQYRNNEKDFKFHDKDNIFNIDEVQPEMINI